MRFTQEQTDIIEHEHGNVVVIAGAGAGKTRCLVERTSRLIDKGYSPPSILIFTFTRKAALEIGDRVAKKLNLDRSSLEIEASTIHSLALKIFRDNSELLSFSDQPTIWDPRRRGQIITNGIKHFLDNPSTFSKENLELGLLDFDFIDRKKSFKSQEKNKGTRPKYKEDKQYIIDMKAQIELAFEEFPPHPFLIDGISPKAYYTTLIGAKISPDVATIAAEFKQVKDACMILEFDDMIPAAIAILKLGCSYNELFEHIMVDEYQDVNQINVDFIKALMGSHIVSVMAVGDDDQSIYGFRGGDVGHILNFPNVFNGKTLYLTQNFRSTPEIIDLANRVISNNQNRYPKEMRPSRENLDTKMVIPHEPFWTVDYSTRIMEYQFDQYSEVYDYIQGLIYFVEESPSNIAILARNNFNLRMAYSRFQKCNEERNNDIPFDLSNIRCPFQKPIVKKVILWANILINPQDYVSCREALMATVKGFGGKTAEYFTSMAKSMPDGNVVSWLQGLHKYPRHGKQTKKYKILQSVAQEIEEHLLLKNGVDLFEFWILAAGCSGLNAKVLEQLNVSSSNSSIDREFLGNENDLALKLAQENIQTFMSTLPDKEKTDHKKLLDYIATEISLSEERNGVQLMTIHASKGKEWPIVFLIDIVDSVIPSPQSTDIEEERRLLYVGITRAADELHLSYFEKDREWEKVDKSSFWNEMQLPENNLGDWLRDIERKNKELENERNNL